VERATLCARALNKSRAERDRGSVENDQKKGKSRYRGKEENRIN